METVIHLGLGIYLIYSAWYWLQLSLTKDQESFQFDIEAAEHNCRTLFAMVGCFSGAISVWLFFEGDIIEATVTFCVALFMFAIRKRASRQLALKQQGSFCRAGHKPTKFLYLAIVVYCGLLGAIMLVNTWS